MLSQKRRQVARASISNHEGDDLTPSTHIAVQSQRVWAFLNTKLQISSPSRTSPDCAGTSLSLMSGSCLHMCFDPLSHSLSSHVKNPFDSAEAGTLQASP